MGPTTTSRGGEYSVKLKVGSPEVSQEGLSEYVHENAALSSCYSPSKVFSPTWAPQSTPADTHHNVGGRPWDAGPPG